MIIVLLLQLSACGYQLRGLGEEYFANKSLSVESDKKAVEPFIRQVLASQLVTDVANPELKIDIFLKSAAFNKRVLVLDANAQPVKQLLLFVLNYKYQMSNGISGINTVKLERSYYYNAEELASISQYEDSVKRQMLNDAARQIRQQLMQRVK